MPEKKQTFEDQLERLEKIVEEMESGELSLDDMMKRFEEGSALIKTCGKKLDEVEKKIEQLVKKDGVLTTEPFNPEQDTENTP